jgi:spermidine/putrescine-binding protein
VVAAGARRVLGYSKEAFPDGKQPKSWVEFWDVAKFPGARMLEDMAAGTPNLEFALIADGVPMDKVYPIDIDRAFKLLSRIKPHIKKFWDTGALSAQMLADKEIVLGSIWNGRLQASQTRARRWRSSGTSTCCRSKAMASSRTPRTRRKRSFSSIMR